MTARPDMTGFGAAPQTPSGSSRFRQYLTTALAGGAGMMIALLVYQRFAPTSLTPAAITGTAAGQAEVSEIETKKAVKLAYEAGLAEAHAEVAVRQAAEIEDNRAQQQATLDGSQGALGMANLADVACIGGAILGALGTATTGPDIHNGASTVARTTCGMGSAIRQSVTGNQIQVGRTGGVLMTRNTYGETTAPQPVALPASAPAGPQPSRHYSPGEVMKARDYARTLPSDVQRQLTADLSDDDTGWDIFTERTRSYIVASTSSAATPRALPERKPGYSLDGQPLWHNVQRY